MMTGDWATRSTITLAERIEPKTRAVYIQDNTVGHIASKKIWPNDVQKMDYQYNSSNSLVSLRHVEQETRTPSSSMNSLVNRRISQDVHSESIGLHVVLTMLHINLFHKHPKKCGATNQLTQQNHSATLSKRNVLRPTLPVHPLAGESDLIYIQMLSDGSCSSLTK